MVLKGLALPLRVGPNGRTLIDSGDDHATKVLRVSLGDCDSRNAFQLDAGLGEEHVFAVPNDDLRSTIRRRLRAVFAEFEAQLLFRLVEETIIFSEEADTGDLVLSFSYVNLESDEEKQFEQTFKGRK